MRASPVRPAPSGLPYDGRSVPTLSQYGVGHRGQPIAKGRARTVGIPARTSPSAAWVSGIKVTERVLASVINSPARCCRLNDLQGWPLSVVSMVPMAPRVPCSPRFRLSPLPDRVIAFAARVLADNAPHLLLPRRSIRPIELFRTSAGTRTLGRMEHVNWRVGYPGLLSSLGVIPRRKGDECGELVGQGGRRGENDTPLAGRTNSSKHEVWEETGSRKVQMSPKSSRAMSGQAESRLVINR